MPQPRHNAVAWVERDQAYRYGWWARGQFYPCGPSANNPMTAELLFRHKQIERTYALVKTPQVLSPCASPLHNFKDFRSWLGEQLPTFPFLQRMLGFTDICVSLGGTLVLPLCKAHRGIEYLHSEWRLVPAEKLL